MNSKRLHFILLGVLVLAIIGLFGTAYLVNGLLGKQATTLANLKLQTQSLSSQQTGLKKAKKDIATYSDLEKITKQIVPEDKDQAAAVREIVNIAATNGIVLDKIDFPPSTLGATTGGGAAASAAAPTTPAAGTSKSALSQLTAVPNIPGVYNLQITIQNGQDNLATYAKFYNFLASLENNRRTAQVANINITPDPDNRNLLSFTLILNEYIKP